MSDEVRHQYATSANLAKRGSFLGRYGTVNGFGWLVDRMDLASDMAVLDVGCSPAWLWRAQAERVPDGLRLTLADASNGMIAEARANLAKRADRFCEPAFLVADATALPFEDALFDAVLLLHVLYHVPDRRTALKEAHRVLRPGGKVFVSTNTRDNMSELHAIGARIYGGEAVDPGAARFSLDDAEREVSDLFGDVRRDDLTDAMDCTDPNDALAVLLSMPPGNAASPDERERVAASLHEATKRDGGRLRVTRRTGLVEGTRC